MSDETQTAMLLTQEEWRDLAAICDDWQFLVADGTPFPGPALARMLKLCNRIRDAA